MTPALAASIRGGRVAVSRLGRWPTIGTIDDYVGALRRAQREMAHVVELER